MCCVDRVLDLAPLGIAETVAAENSPPDCFQRQLRIACCESEARSPISDLRIPTCAKYSLRITAAHRVSFTHRSSERKNRSSVPEPRRIQRSAQAPLRFLSLISAAQQPISALRKALLFSRWISDYSEMTDCR